jgi:hypothetical protein
LVLLLIDAVRTIIEIMLQISASPDGIQVWKHSVSDFDIPGKHDRGSLSYLSSLPGAPSFTNDVATINHNKRACVAFCTINFTQESFRVKKETMKEFK